MARILRRAQERAIQAIEKLYCRADARLLDGPVKPGHDMTE